MSNENCGSTLLNDKEQMVPSKADESDEEIVLNTEDFILTEESFFFTQKNDIHQVMREIRRNAESLRSRLHSIYFDSLFVTSFMDRVQRFLPLIANMRCGRWYSSTPVAECHFKSTDGHGFQSNFSTTRLNLHILKIIQENGGCIIVDATKKGKIYPDSFNRTIPVWCAVINAIIRECHKDKRIDGDSSANHRILAEWMPDSEEFFAQKQLPIYIKEFRNVVGEDIINTICSRSRYSILKPIWVCPSSTSVELALSYLNCTQHKEIPVVCLSASSPLTQRTSTNTSYIQGAADDEESWSRGLTPRVFWENSSMLLTIENDDKLTESIESLVLEDKQQQTKTDRYQCKIWHHPNKVSWGEWVDNNEPFMCPPSSETSFSFAFLLTENEEANFNLVDHHISTLKAIVQKCTTSCKRPKDLRTWEKLLHSIFSTLQSVNTEEYNEEVNKNPLKSTGKEDISVIVIPDTPSLNLVALFVAVGIRLYCSKINRITKTHIRTELAQMQACQLTTRCLTLPRYLVKQLTRCMNT